MIRLFGMFGFRTSFLLLFSVVAVVVVDGVVVIVLLYLFEELDVFCRLFVVCIIG